MDGVGDPVLEQGIITSAPSATSNKLSIGAEIFAGTVNWTKHKDISSHVGLQKVVKSRDTKEII